MQDQINNLKDAREKYKEGMEYMETNCLQCRFSPSYIDAIPLLKIAAEKFHGSNKLDEEICTREKLIQCFRATKSFWEEGNEYEKICKIQTKQLSKFPEAFTSISNAHIAYIAAHSYSTSVKSIKTAALDFIQCNEKDFAERIMKISFDSISQCFHVWVLNKEESHDFVYEAVKQYIDILFDENKINTAIETAEQFVKVISHDEEDKTKVIYYNCIVILGYWCLGDKEKYEEALNKTKDYCSSEGVHDKDGYIKLVENTNKIMNGNDEKKWNSWMTDLGYEFPNGIGKMIRSKAKTGVKEGNQGEEVNTTDEAFNDFK